MPNYKFTAVNQAGEKISSKIEADDAVLAQEMLRTQGYTMIENIKEESLFDKDLNFNFGKKKVTPRDLSVFCRQFVSITTAGVTIVDALEMLAMQTENPTLQAAIMDTSTSVKKGETLANGLKRKGTDIFPAVQRQCSATVPPCGGSLRRSFFQWKSQTERQNARHAEYAARLPENAHRDHRRSVSDDSLGPFLLQTDLRPRQRLNKPWR